METITQTKKLFSNLSEILNNTSTQVTAQQLINRRIYINGEGWQDIELTDEFNNNLAEQIAETLGGHRATKESIKYTLMYARPQHWGLNRVLLEQYNDSAPRFNYCAGQDYTTETNTIRKALK
jgi:hypothetical protein